jgi:hypothetical protein
MIIDNSPERKTRTGLLGNFLPPKRDDVRNTAFCAECKALKRISGMFLMDGSKAKISDAGPFFCSCKCAYVYKQARQPPDFAKAKTSRKAEYVHNYNLTHKAEAAIRSRKCYLEKVKPRRQAAANIKVPRDKLRLAEAGDDRVSAPARVMPKRTSPSLESLIGIPCAEFGCLDKHACDPKTCGKLSEWLFKVTGTDGTGAFIDDHRGRAAITPPPDTVT